MIRAVVPDSVHAKHDDGGQLVLLDTASGRWYVLNRTGAAFFQELHRTADIERATDAVAARYPDVPADQLRRDIEELVSALVHRGLVELPDRIGRHSASVLMALPNDGARIDMRRRLVAPAAFASALLLLRLPFRTTAGLVTRLTKAKPTATTVDALAALDAARWISRWYPGRVACLELTLTAVLIGAFLGFRIDWCFGFAVDPYTFHAWIEIGEEPVTHPADEPILSTYRRVFRT